MRLCLPVLVILTFFCAPLRAQFSAPVKDSILSRVLNEQRDIEIILPSHYDSDTAHYDVWYVPDGEWNTHTFTNIFSFLVAIQFAPPAIIVGVPNRYVNGFNLRDRDLTPTPIAYVDSSGGAKNFLAFFEQELIPYINSRYRVSGENGIFGSSFGGLFTIYAMLEKPSLFRFYATGDPALHNDGRLVPKLAAQRFPHMNFSNTVLSIGGRDGISYHEMARDLMDSVLKTAAPAGLHWQSTLYTDETHGSSVFKSNYDGLKYSYLGYFVRNARCYPNRGIVLKERPVRVFVPTDHSDIRYTTDGTLPTRSGKKMDDHLLVSEPEKLKIYSFSPSGRYDHEIPVELRSGDYLYPEKPTTKFKNDRRLTGTFKGSTSGLMDGWVQIDKEGYYVLQCTPPVGTKLFFNGSLLLHADEKTAHTRQAIILPLRPGRYALRVERPVDHHVDSPLYFGLYYSENGHDDWWTNPIVRW